MKTGQRNSCASIRLSLSCAIALVLYGAHVRAAESEAAKSDTPVSVGSAAESETLPGGAASPDSARLETVTVTANKRVEKLESTPGAISVLTDTIIQRNNVRDVNDVVNLSPALSITYGSTPANNGINMRGIGTQSIGIGVEADVAVIIDDVPTGMQVRAFNDLDDISRVEVLKGPQSTLFGKSAIAGAVNIATKAAGGPMQGTGSVYYTSDGEWRATGSFGGAVSDTFAFRISAADSDFPGNVKNLTTDSHVNGTAGKALRAKFSWQPLDNFDVDFSARYGKQTTNCCVLVPVSFNPLQGALLSNILQLPATQLLAGIPIGPDNRDVRSDYPTGQQSNDRGASVKLTYTLPNGTSLMSISSYDKYRAHDYRDQDFTDFPVLLYYPLANGKPAGIDQGNTQYGTFRVESTTQEFRLVSPDDSVVKYVAGLWYAKNSIDRTFVRGYNGIALTTPTDYGGATYNRNYAVFGQADWEFRPGWTLTAGLRQNREISGYWLQFYQVPPLAQIPLPNRYYQSIDNGENATTGKLSLQHQFNEDLMGYVQYSTGYKGLAYDITSGLTAATAALQPIKSETARSYEIGIKDNFLDGRATLNADVFYTHFENFQQNSGSYLPDTTTYVTRLNSVPWVYTKGLEVDASFLLFENLVLNGGFSYTIAKIGSFPNGPCYNVAGSPNAGYNAACNPKSPIYGGPVQDLSGAPLPNAPKFKFNLGGQYDIPLAQHPFNAFVNGNYRFQTHVVTNLNQDPTQNVPGFGILNLGAGIHDKEDRYKLSFLVNNVLDRHYAMTGFTGLGNWSSKAPNPVVNVSTATWTPARDAFRYYGIRFDYNFR